MNDRSDVEGMTRISVVSQNEFQRSRTLQLPKVIITSNGMSVTTDPVTFCFETSVKGGVSSVTPLSQLSPLDSSVRDPGYYEYEVCNIYHVPGAR